MKPWIDKPGYIATPPREGSVWVYVPNGKQAVTRYTEDRQFWYFVYIGWHVERLVEHPSGDSTRQRFETDPVPTWLVPNPEAWVPAEPVSPRVQGVIDALSAMPEVFTSGSDLLNLVTVLTAMDPTPEEAYDLMAWVRGLEPYCDLPLDISHLNPGNKYVATIARLEDLMRLRSSVEDLMNNAARGARSSEGKTITTHPTL